MQRSSSKRSFNKIIQPTINFNEINILQSFKDEIKNSVTSYINKKTDRDLTITNLNKISEKLKSKLSTFS
jgi:hypothetical protein